MSCFNMSELGYWTLWFWVLNPVIIGTMYQFVYRFVNQTLVRGCGTNLLKLNQDKTELIIFAPKHRMQTFTQCDLVFYGIVVSDASFVTNLGVYFDKTLTMDKQYSAIAKFCYYQIRNIGRKRSYISDDICKTRVCSLVTSRLDYGNALVYGVNRTVIDRLQRVQNTAARMITRRRKHDHITPILVALHWLPVQYRCQYKIIFRYQIVTCNCSSLFQWTYRHSSSM